SSRRRHTIFKCDWSSDVCSSDLFLSGGSWRTSWASPTRCIIVTLAIGHKPQVAERVGDAQLVLQLPPDRKALLKQRARCVILPRSEERRVGKGGGSRQAAFGTAM